MERFIGIRSHREGDGERDRASLKSEGAGHIKKRFSRVDSYLDYYRSHSNITNPGKYAYLFEELSLDIPSLCAVIQGVMVHRESIALYDKVLARERKGQYNDVKLKTVSAMLAEIVKRRNEQLSIGRELKDKLAVVCRDSAILLCSILRHLNVPARTRTIFPLFFKLPDKYKTIFYYDHWICEYWDSNKRRWIAIDAQLNDIEKKEYCSIEINNYDLPPGLFIYSGNAWQLYRIGTEKADNFGEPDSPSHGYELLRRHLLLDFASLNKYELFAWTDLGIKDVSVLDEIANLTIRNDTSFVDLLALFKKLQPNAEN